MPISIIKNCAVLYKSKRLMDRALAELGKLGYSKVMLFVLDKNTSARKFYENYGFTAGGDRMNKKYGHKTVTQIVYTIEQDIKKADE